MKKRELVLVSLTIMILLSACGNDKGAAAAENAIPVASGKPFDCNYFTMTVAEGWEAGPLTFGMVNVLPKGEVSPGLYFKFEGDGNAAGTAEGSIRSMIQNYGGSPLTDTTIAGIGFKTTTYSYSGMTQTMHVAYRNGSKITITLEGVNAKDNPEIKAMLTTLVLK